MTCMAIHIAGEGNSECDIDAYIGILDSDPIPPFFTADNNWQECLGRK